MKLRNKKTGEIIQLNVKCENGGELRTFDLNTNTDNPITLAELNKEWEDYKEPKEYWYVDCYGGVQWSDYRGTEWDEHRKQIGNYFRTKEEAEKAVEKLKAWKLLKDRGFKFEGFCRSGADIDFSFYGERSGGLFENTYEALRYELGLLFGGEE